MTSKDRNCYLIALFLLAIFLIESLYAITYYSPTFDETAYLGASYYYWKTGNITVVKEHPPLTRILAGAPLVLLNPDYPGGEWNNSQQMRLGETFLYEIGNDLDSILLVSRLTTVALSMILGFSLFFFAKNIYGIKAGVFALFLYAFEVTIIGQGSLATTDLAITLFMFLTMYAFWHFTKEPSYKNAFLASIFFALAQLSKFTGLYLVPILFVLLAFFLYKKSLQLRHAVMLIAVIAVTSVLIINMFYLFQGTGKALTDTISADRIEKYITDHPLKPIIMAVVKTPLPLPQYYVVGISDSIFHNISGHKTFFLGEYSQYGWWYYFPVVFLLKVSVFLLAFIAISSYVFYKKCFEKGHLANAEHIAIAFILMVFLLNTFSHINIGVRHVLPVFPFIIFLCAKSIKYIDNRYIYVIAILYALSSIMAAPHYMSFFNEVVGSENGYKYSADSNIDWGQDIKAAFIWLNESQIRSVSHRVQGEMSANYYANIYGINATQMNCTPVTGVVMISVAHYHDMHNIGGNYDCFDWVKGHELIKRIGNSIFIYRI